MPSWIESQIMGTVVIRIGVRKNVFAMLFSIPGRSARLPVHYFVQVGVHGGYAMVMMDVVSVRKSEGFC